MSLKQRASMHNNVGLANIRKGEAVEIHAQVVKTSAERSILYVLNLRKQRKNKAAYLDFQDRLRVFFDVPQGGWRYFELSGYCLFTSIFLL